MPVPEFDLNQVPLFLLIPTNLARQRRSNRQALTCKFSLTLTASCSILSYFSSNDRTEDRCRRTSLRWVIGARGGVLQQGNSEGARKHRVRTSTKKTRAHTSNASERAHMGTILVCHDDETAPVIRLKTNSEPDNRGAKEPTRNTRDVSGLGRSEWFTHDQRSHQFLDPLFVFGCELLQTPGRERAILVGREACSADVVLQRNVQCMTRQYRRIHVLISHKMVARC